MSDGTGPRERIEAVSIIAERNRTAFAIAAPARHHDVIRHMAGLGYDAGDVPPANQGFLTDRGRFVDRTEAWGIAEAAGQLIRRESGPQGTLYSENLW